MTLYKIVAPGAAPPANLIGQPGTGCWLVNGVGYTTSDPVANYCTRAGYTVTTVGSVPQTYSDQASSLSKQRVIKAAGPVVDGADPNSVNRHPTLGGDNTGDVNNVLAGFDPRGRKLD